MVKTFLPAYAAALLTLTACSGNSEKNVTLTDSTDTISGAANVSEAHEQYSYTPEAGDVTYREKKLRVWRNDNWVDTTGDVSLDSGIVVSRTGRVLRNGSEYQLEDSQVVRRGGNIFDKTGHALENAWDATKEGVKKAGKAIGKAAKKVGDKIDSANN